MSKVVLIKCGSYDEDEVVKAIDRGMEMLGGASAFAKPGEKILFKPNILAAESPEKCVTTHPSVFKAVCGVFSKTDAILSYGDSPGANLPEIAASKAGFAAVAKETGVRFADFRNGTEVFYQGALQDRKFVIADGVLESDGLISLPKLKTHGLSRMTGCLKNQFGCIPGPLKAEFHLKIPNVFDFFRMIADLNCYLKPRLYIMDGIMAMEGNGPRGGQPKKLGVLLFSTDPVALDATACRIIGLDPEFVPSMKPGAEAGLGTYNIRDIELLGDPLESVADPDFCIVREPVSAFDLNGFKRFLKKWLVPKPCISEDKCVKCGVCVNICPVKPKALVWADIGDTKSKAPEYRYDRCIRCYCCQELCPEGAIRLDVPFLRRLIGFIHN